MFNWTIHNVEARWSGLDVSDWHQVEVILCSDKWLSCEDIHIIAKSKMVTDNSEVSYGAGPVMFHLSIADYIRMESSSRVWSSCIYPSWIEWLWSEYKSFILSYDTWTGSTTWFESTLMHKSKSRVKQWLKSERTNDAMKNIILMILTPMISRVRVNSYVKKSDPSCCFRGARFLPDWWS